MSLVDSSANQSHPDWVSMDIEKIGKSFYNDDQPLDEHIRGLKAKALADALRKRTEYVSDCGTDSGPELHAVNGQKPRTLEDSGFETKPGQLAPNQSKVNHPKLKLDISKSDTSMVGELGLSQDASLLELGQFGGLNLTLTLPLVLPLELSLERPLQLPLKETLIEPEELNDVLDSPIDALDDTPNINSGDVASQNDTIPETELTIAPHPDDIFFEYSRTTDGLVNSSLRSKIWPILLDIKEEHSPKSKLGSASASLFLEDLNYTDLPPHKDEDQVKLDIQRSFTVLSHIQSLNQAQSDSYTTIFSRSDIDDLKKKLQHLIIKILRKYPALNYYQGYHDVASIVLLVCHVSQTSDLNASGILVDEALAFKILEKLTVCHLRDFMITDINLSINHLKIIPTLLENIDPSLFKLIKHSSNSYVLTDGIGYDYTFYQGLSSILTFFSHDMSNLQHILILWDFILSYNSVLTTEYIYVATLIYFKDNIFTKLNLTDSVLQDHLYDSVDKDLVHTLISPASLFDSLTDQDLIKILNKANILIDDFPINGLENKTSTFETWFNSFNKHSVLLNTSNLYLHRTHKNFPFINEQSESLSELIQTQNEEMAQQSIHDLQIQRKILEQQEELESSIHTANTEFDDLLNSSSLSLTSSSSSFNTKIANTSSLILKKIFNAPTPELPNSSKIPTNILYLNNVYKISFTVGFVGFLLHFLLSKNNSGYNQTLARIFNPSVELIKGFTDSVVNSESIGSISRDIGSMGNGVFNEVGLVFRQVGNLVTEPVNNGLYVGQIGLGNLRNSIFSLMG